VSSGGIDEAECGVNLGEKLGGGDAPSSATEAVSVFEGCSSHGDGARQAEVEVAAITLQSLVSSG
jgi:hypothetical protein